MYFVLYSCRGPGTVKMILGIAAIGSFYGWRYAAWLSSADALSKVRLFHRSWSPVPAPSDRRRSLPRFDPGAGAGRPGRHETSGKLSNSPDASEFIDQGQPFLKPFAHRDRYRLVQSNDGRRSSAGLTRHTGRRFAPIRPVRGIGASAWIAAMAACN